jgi:hypothetical protein
MCEGLPDLGGDLGAAGNHAIRIDKRRSHKKGFTRKRSLWKQPPGFSSGYGVYNEIRREWSFCTTTVRYLQGCRSSTPENSSRRRIEPGSLGGSQVEKRDEIEFSGPKRQRAEKRERSVVQTSLRMRTKQISMIACHRRKIHYHLTMFW